MIMLEQMLKESINELNLKLNVENILNMIEENFYEFPISSMQFNDIIFQKSLTKLQKRSKIAIVGVTKYFLPYIDEFKENFNEVILFDDYAKIENLHITNKEEVLMDDSIECFLVLPRDRAILEKFQRRIKNKEKIVWIVDLIIEENKKKVRKKEIDIFFNKYISKRSQIFLSGFFSNNYVPLFELFKQRGYKTAFLVRKDWIAMANVSIKKHYDSVLVLRNSKEFEYVLNKLPKDLEVFINWDSFRTNVFSGKNALSALLYTIAVFKVLKAKKNLLLYDPSPLIKDEFEYAKDIMKALGMLLNLSDRIIYNSSTKDMSEFQKNIFNINKPMINFYRYNKKLKKPIPERSKNDFYLIMIGIFLDNTHDPMRSGMRENIKNILNQEIHMHYLSYIENDYRLEEFISSLSKEQKRYFHVEKTIVDQDEMIEFISQFNAGWMLHNTNAMCETISKNNCQEYKDMMHVFLEATVTSSILAHGCAGLPIFINRSMQGIQKEFPKEFFIPIELSETKNIRKIIKSIDWEERYKFCYENRGLFSIEDNIDKLIKFLGKKNGYQRKR